MLFSQAIIVTLFIETDVLRKSGKTLAIQEKTLPIMKETSAIVNTALLILRERMSGFPILKQKAVRICAVSIYGLLFLLRKFVPQRGAFGVMYLYVLATKSFAGNLAGYSLFFAYGKRCPPSFKFSFFFHGDVNISIIVGKTE